MTTKESTKAKAFYKSEIKRATTIDELVWIMIDISSDLLTLTCDDLAELSKTIAAKREIYERAGQKYTSAKRPSWR